MSASSPKNILNSLDIKPSKGLGQNFLVDKNALNKIIKAADIKSNDVILEIGPGLGVLTKELAKRAKKVIAVEKDKKMIAVLRETLKDYKNVEIINADALKVKLDTKNYKVVANLPYYITSPVIRKFLESENQPNTMILMVQKEVGQRICSKPPDMNLLAISVQIYSKPEIVSYISKNSFWPKPKVDSAIIKISDIKKPDINTNLFFKIVKAGFSQPRKQLVNNISKGLKLTKETALRFLNANGIDSNRRAEILNVKDWINLTNNLPIE